MGGSNDVLRYPLDALLGAEANVRLLRLLLHELQVPVSASEAAEYTGLTRAGARKALNRLAQGGFLTRIGSGRTQHYTLRGDDPLLHALAELFRAEHGRYDSTLKRMRHAFDGVREVYAAWIQSTPQGPGDPLEISVVATSDALSWLKEDLRSKLRDLERELDVIIEITAYSKADAPDVDPSEVILLAGVLEQAKIADVPPVVRHEERDERALQMSRGIAELLRSDPSLARRALHHVERLLNEEQGLATRDLREWRQVLETYSPERLQDFIKSGSSRAARLRQSSPFFAVLRAEERDSLIRYLQEEG